LQTFSSNKASREASVHTDETFLNPDTPLGSKYDKEASFKAAKAPWQIISSFSLSRKKEQNGRHTKSTTSDLIICFQTKASKGRKRKRPVRQIYRKRAVRQQSPVLAGSFTFTQTIGGFSDFSDLHDSPLSS
jgi:hypothetical protein